MPSLVFGVPRAFLSSIAIRLGAARNNLYRRARAHPRLRCQKRGKRAKAHIKVDTGMNRQGLLPTKVKAFAGLLADIRRSRWKASTRIADADSSDPTFTNLADGAFKAALAEFSRPASCRNTAISRTSAVSSFIQGLCSTW